MSSFRHNPILQLTGLIVGVAAIVGGIVVGSHRLIIAGIIAAVFAAGLLLFRG
jgi:hypothetical protein